MGKHDKTSFKWARPEETEVISCDVNPEEFYKSRIAELKAENARLRDELHKVQMSVGNYELVIDHQDEMHTGIISEYKEELAEKDDEIEILKGEIKMLKEAVVKGALREVLA